MTGVPCTPRIILGTIPGEAIPKLRRSSGFCASRPVLPGFLGHRIGPVSAADRRILIVTKP
eukprot:5360889-Pyramimonas_sp.AAC.1